MKKTLLELSTEEFVRIICDTEEEYTITLHDCSTGEEQEVKGKYDVIYNSLLNVVITEPDNTAAQRCLKQFEDKCFDYNLAIYPLDIYNYLDEKTKGFQSDRCKIILREMKLLHDMYIDEDRLEYINSLIDDGWTGYKTISEQDNMIDYKDAYTKVFGVAYDVMYYEAINLLKEKLGYNVSISNKPQSTTTEKPINSSFLPDNIIDKAVNAGLLERTENGLKWIKTASLYGYFIDKVSDKLNLKTSSNRIQWKDFCFIENHYSLLNTAKQAVNGYKNKNENPPEGDDIVNMLFK